MRNTDMAPGEGEIKGTDIDSRPKLGMQQLMEGYRGILPALGQVDQPKEKD